jgi:hypothetical protein
MKICSLFFCTFLSLICVGQGQIEGYVIDKTTEKPLINTEISLWIIDSIRYDSSRKKALDSKEFSPYSFSKQNFIDTTYKRIQKKFSDSAGHCVFDNLNPNFYSVIAFHVTEVRDKRKYGEFEELRGIFVNCDSKIKQLVRLRVFCEYDLTQNLTHCPHCHKKDKAIIRNGLYPPGGEEEEPGYYYSGYCIVERCHPTKRCMRCDYEF